MHVEEFGWEERARAWDKSAPDGQRLLEEERAQRLHARLQTIREHIAQGLGAIGKAEFAELSPKEARILLPNLRALVVDLLKIESQHEALIEALGGKATQIDADLYAMIRGLVLEEMRKKQTQAAQPAASGSPQ